LRPLFLKISGLNSFREEQQVDFTSLCEIGVFGIFGPTGSGKSTVLDAITLALYGKVERAKGGTHGIINQNEDRAYVRFSFQVGSRRFTAERTYKKGNDGSVNQYSCRLIEEMEEGFKVLAEKKREMDEQIQNILGLTVEDFTRAVVLPQGKFQEFLTLQGSERRKMLQRIFTLEKYGEELTKKIKDRLNTAKLKEEQIRSRQSELGDASAEAVKQAQNTLKSHLDILKDLKEQEQKIKKEHEELKQVIQWQAELTSELEKMKILKTREQELKKKEEKLELALRAIHVKPFLDIVNNELKNRATVALKANQLEKEVETSKLEFERVEKLALTWQDKVATRGEELKFKLRKLDEVLEFEQKRDEMQNIREKLQGEYKELNSLNNGLLEEIKQLERSRALLQDRKKLINQEIEKQGSIVEKQEEAEQQKEAWLALQEVEKRFSELEKEMKIKEENIKTIKEKLSRLKKQVDEVNVSLTSAEKSLDSLPLPPLDQAQLNRRRDEINKLEKMIMTLEYYHQEIEKTTQELDKSEQEKVFLQKKFDREEKRYNFLHHKEEQIVKDIKRLEQTLEEMERANYAALLSNQLTANHPCPVCGSLEHPHPFTQQEEHLEKITDLRKDLVGKKDQLNQLETELKDVFQGQSILRAQLANLANNNSRLKEELEKAKEKLEEITSQFPLNWQKLSLEEIKNNHKVELADLNKVQENIEQYIKTKEKLGQEINLIKDKYTKLKLEQREEAAKLTALEAEQERIHNKFKLVLSEREEKATSFIKLAKGQSGQEVMARVQSIRKARQELEYLRKEERQITESLENIIDNLFKKKEEKEKVQQKIEALINEGQSYKRQVMELTEKINEVTQGKKVIEVRDIVENELKELNNGLARVLDEKEKKQKIWSEKKTIFYSTQQELEQIGKRLEKAQKEMKLKLAQYNFVSQGQVEASLCTDQEMDFMKNEINEYNQDKLITEKNITDYQKKLAGRRLSEEEWNDFQEKMLRVQTELENQIEIVHKMEDRLEILEKNHLRWQELEKERKNWQSLMDKLSQLEKLFRGNTFVEFLAEEQLMHVAINASQRLGELTNYRYALEVDSEGGFVIRDDANGGLRRPVTTLSGGETFLTSLALALALSSQIQLRGKYPLEFFFLDEGFGTLDNHLLEIVINSLERLHLEKMTIGVISHVPELRARMARSLLVEPAERGGRGTRLRIEKA
jgi:exonuclease SbcC